jgi:hypothetical protein
MTRPLPPDVQEALEFVQANLLDPDGFIQWGRCSPNAERLVTLARFIREQSAQTCETCQREGVTCSLFGGLTSILRFCAAWKARTL